MEKEIYRVGDRVYHWRYGWGDVDYYNEKDSSPVVVQFLKGGRSSFTDAGIFNQGEPPSLSFTYYDFVNGGFSQVRPLPNIEVDTVVYVRIANHDEWVMRYFSHFDSDGKINCFSNQKNSTQTISTSSWSQYNLINPLIDNKE